MYIILQADIENARRYDSDALAMLHERRNLHLTGASESYTVEETVAYAKSPKK